MSQNNTSASNIPKQEKQRLWVWILGLVLITLCCYAPVFSGDKEFTNWDDDSYVTNQPLIQSLDGAHLKKIFDPASAVMFNYHPVTMLSLAIDYQRAYDEDSQTLSIVPFVKTNLFFHLLNTVLVFLLLSKLTEKKSLLLAAIAAAIFGIHPLHVESVAWISERKDVLYCFFFLLSCLAYIRYLNQNKIAWLAVSFLCFIVAGLSKAMAIPLPFILLLVDYLRRRPFTIRVIMEKAPFLIVAIVLGLYTLKVQQGAITDFHVYSIGNKLLFAGTALGLYLIKWIVPFRLSAFYPYPDVHAGSALPVLYYVLPLLIVAAFVSLFLLLKRKDSHYTRPVIFGIGFFLLMIVLVLPVVGVGSAVMADRYTYVSSIGLLFLIPSLLQPFTKQLRWKQILLGSLVAFTFFYAIFTFRRIAVWDNSRNLWTDVIDQYPIRMNGVKATNLGAKTAYKNLADYYIAHDQYDSAFAYYQILTSAGTNDAEVWNNLGNIYVSRKDMSNALKSFNQAIALDTTNADTYMVRAIILGNASNFKEAIKDVDKVLQLRPNDTQAKAMRDDMLKRIK